MGQACFTKKKADFSKVEFTPIELQKLDAMEHRIRNYKTSLNTAFEKKCKKGNFSSVELISTYQSNVANRKKNYDVDDLAEIERELDESALQLSHVRTATGTPPMETLYRELKV